MSVPVVALVGGDLMARARLQDAADRHGVELLSVAPGTLEQALRDTELEILILDLDAGGIPLLEELDHVREAGPAPARVVGFFSHVDHALGEAATSRGCDAMPRGRFWRTLPELLGPLGRKSTEPSED